MSIQSIQYLWYTFHICLTYPFNLSTFDLLLSSLNPGSFDFVTIGNFVIAQQGEVLELGQTANWVVSSSRANISVPATVPGGVYSDLRQVKNGTKFHGNFVLISGGCFEPRVVLQVQWCWVQVYGSKNKILWIQTNIICLPIAEGCFCNILYLKWFICTEDRIKEIFCNNTKLCLHYW